MSKDIIITIQDLIQGRNKDFYTSKKIKLLRHKKSQSEDIKISNELYKGSLYNLYRTEPQKFLTECFFV